MFKSERQLSRVIKQKLCEDPTVLFKGSRKLQTFITTELSMGHGVADLVVSFHKKIKKRSQPLTLHDLNILNIVKKNNSITIKEIESATRTSSERVKNSIRRLEKEKLIESKDEYLFSFNDYINYQAETIAIEVKLKNWKRALEQAYRYRCFAFHSYVFLDKRHASPAIKNKTLFLRYNIGLASVSKEGKIEFHFKPKKGNPFDERLNMLFNESIVHYHLSCKNVNQASR